VLEITELLIHFITTVMKLLKPGGVKVVMVETIAMKQQLIVINRPRRRAPALATSDRFLFGLLAMLIGERRLQKAAAILKPATRRWSILVNIHRACKRQTMFSRPVSV
jgi:hypothetical protein